MNKKIVKVFDQLKQNNIPATLFDCSMIGGDAWALFTFEQDCEKLENLKHRYENCLPGHAPRELEDIIEFPEDLYTTVVRMFEDKRMKGVQISKIHCVACNSDQINLRDRKCNDCGAPFTDERVAELLDQAYKDYVKELESEGE